MLQIDCLTWPIIFRPPEEEQESSAALTALQSASLTPPSQVITLASQLQHPNMPQEVGILLPTSPGPRRLIDAISQQQDFPQDAILGLFLADPLINIAREQQRLHQAGVTWIANLPSVEQQDLEFSRQLPDVDLDQNRELKALADFRHHGFKIAAVVADTASAERAAALAPDLFMVLPRVADFAAGFPSPRQRRAAALEISKVLKNAGLAIPTLGLAELSERDHPRQWPETLDGLICRPQVRDL